MNNSDTFNDAYDRLMGLWSSLLNNQMEITMETSMETSMETINLFSNSWIENNDFLYQPLLQNEVIEDINVKSIYKNILSKEGRNQLTFLTFDNCKQTECPIAQESFIQGENIVELPCKHIFKKKPILQWLENENAICPLCRFQLKSKEIKKKVKDNLSDELGNDWIIYDNDIQLAIEQSLQDLPSVQDEHDSYELIPSKPIFLPPNYIAPPLPKKLPYPPILDD